MAKKAIRPEWALRVRTELLKREMTQQALAKAVGVHATFLNGVLKGYRPGVVAKAKVMRYLGIEE
jgi:transcriptional regulator with XRE-family HTH domain